MKQHYLVAAILFLVCVIGATVFHESVAVSIVLICAGALVATIVLFSPTFNQKESTGKFRFSRKGVVFEWKIHDNQIRTILPQNQTNSAQNQKAIELYNEGCNLARIALARIKSDDKEVDLNKAIKKFRKAASLDSQYWEPRIGIAQCLLLAGQTRNAFSDAESIRLFFPGEPLAFAKAGLIMAKVIEAGISHQDDKEEQRSKYRVIINLLCESLKKCPGHVTSMKSLRRVILLVGATREEINSFLIEAERDVEVQKELHKSLEQEDLIEYFSSRFPDFPDFFNEENDHEN